MAADSYLTVEPWPWPGDSREDRAKRVALSYRNLVQDIASGRIVEIDQALHRVDRQWASYGVYWPVPSAAPIDPDEWLSAADLAHLVDRTPRDIYDWARRGHITQRPSADGSPEYAVASVLDYLRAQRLRRTGG